MDQKPPDPATSRPTTDEHDFQQQAAKLALENKILREVLDSMPDNISIKDVKGRYIFDNNAHCRFLGATKPSEVVGKTVYDFLPIEIASHFHAEDLQVVETGQPIIRSQAETVDSAGKRAWMSVSKMPLHDDAGSIIGLVSTTRNITARKLAEQQLARYSQELREKNAQLEEDLETARELQHALLPQQYPRFPSSGLAEESALRFQHFFRSSSGVGGDFFHIFQVSDSVAGVFISDVMGHGVRAALVAAILRTLVEDSRADAREPANFLHGLNQKISEILKHTHMPIFVSACYLMVDLARGELCYANAGHPIPLCVRRDCQTAAPLSFNRSRPDPALGIFGNAEYHGCSCELRAGDTLLLFTDGLFEVQGPDGRYFEQSGLLESVRRNVGLRCGALCERLVNDVKQFAATKDFVDDVCLVAIEIDHLIC
jgi:phosphoserine phosphatase RsbU/P